MMDYLSYIPGPVFLGYFGCFVAVCVLAGYVLNRMDGSMSYPMPEVTAFDGVSLAALRGGWAAVVRTVMFGLWMNDDLKIEGADRSTRIKINWERFGVDMSRPIEKEIASHLVKEKAPREIFKNSVLKENVTLLLGPVLERLEQSGLRRDSTGLIRGWFVYLVMLLLIGGVGGAKLWLGITRDKPVVFLVLMLIVSVVILTVVMKPMARTTVLGRKYLKRVQRHFDWMQDPNLSMLDMKGIDPVLPIAIFGVGVIGKHSGVSAFGSAFTPSSTAAIWYGGGYGCCGAGCGGSGCGDGCGGGCGGCGD